MAARDRQIRFNAVFTANTRSRFFSWQRGGTVHNKWGERGWVEYIFPHFPSVHREDDERMSEQPSFIYSPRCFPNSAVRYSSSCVVGCAAIKQPPLSLSCPATVHCGHGSKLMTNNEFSFVFVAAREKRRIIPLGFLSPLSPTPLYVLE